MSEIDPMVVKQANMLFNMYQISYVAKPTKLVVVSGNVNKISQIEIKAVSTWIKREDGVSTLMVDGMDPIRVDGDEGFSNVSWGTVQAAHGTVKFIICNQKQSRAPIVINGPVDVMELWYDAIRLLISNAPPETQTSVNYRDTLVHGLLLSNVPPEPLPVIPPAPEDLAF